MRDQGKEPLPRDCGCAEATEFDAQQAFRRLAQKHEQLAELVAQYMAEARLPRPTRVKSALAISAAVKMKIIGGNPAKEGDFGNCCLVGQSNPSGQFVWYCSGVLIARRVVLTAAHCINPGEGRLPNVVALNTRSADQTDISHAEVIKLEKAPIRHPLYSPFSKTNDLAVLILKRETETPSVAIGNTQETVGSEQVRVVGFGSNTAAGNQHFGIKRFVDIPIKFIRRTPAQDLDDVEKAFGFESDLEFVAGGDGHDACFGDSGGPAYATIGENLKVIGLVSRQEKNSLVECGSGGIYTRLDCQQEFINSVINANVP